MNCKETNESIPAANLIQCGLHSYGCRDSFPRSEMSKHYLSAAHYKSLINFICSQKLNYESALIELTMNPMGADALSPQATSTTNDYRRLFEQFTTFTDKTAPPSNPPDIASNQTYNSIYISSANLIQQMDRDPNHSLNLQAHQQQRQLNEMMMSQLSNRLTHSSSDGDHENHGIERDQDPPPASAQSTIGLQIYSNSLLRAELDAASVSTDGTLVWPVDKIFTKIDDAINAKQPCINSRQFQTAMDGHRLFARIYLNGKIDPKSISFHVHLNFPVRASFSGDMIFVLVDQSKNKPLQHIIRSCSGEMKNVNDCLGFNEFIDKNILHQEGNPYILDDSVYFLVCIKQTNKQKYSNLPANVQDALMRVQQM